MEKDFIEKKYSRTIDGLKCPTLVALIEKKHIFNVEAGTTGYMGGRFNEKGGRTYISIDFDKEANINITKSKDGDNITIRACGDAELDELIKTFDFITTTLKKQRHEKFEEVNSHKKQNDEQDLFASEKQLNYLAKLLNDTEYRLKTRNIPKSTCSKIIDIFSNKKIFVLEDYQDYIANK